MKGLVIIIYVFMSLSVNGQAEKRMVRKGNAEFRGGKFQEAEKDYRNARNVNPSSSIANYNLANALYKQNQYDAAAREYEHLTENEKEKDKLSRYYYNLGNTLYQNKKYSESVQAYKNALRNNPGDMDAKHNLQMALRMVSKQENQKNSQSRNDDSKNKGDQKQPQDQNKDQKKDQNKDQNNNQNKEQNKEQGDSKPQPGQKNQISKEDAERILQAIENEEKEVMKKVQDQKEQAKKIPVDKNW